MLFLFTQKIYLKIYWFRFELKYFRVRPPHLNKGCVDVKFLQERVVSLQGKIHGSKECTPEGNLSSSTTLQRRIYFDLCIKYLNKTGLPVLHFSLKLQNVKKL